MTTSRRSYSNRHAPLPKVGRPLLGGTEAICKLERRDWIKPTGPFPIYVGTAAVSVLQRRRPQELPLLLKATPQAGIGPKSPDALLFRILCLQSCDAGHA